MFSSQGQFQKRFKTLQIVLLYYVVSFVSFFGKRPLFLSVCLCLCYRDHVKALMELHISNSQTEFVVINSMFADLFPKVIVHKMTYHICHMCCFTGVVELLV